MKLINKLFTMAIAMLAMAAVSACSNDEPDFYKGKVDSELLTSIAQGDVSVSFNLNGYNTYEKSGNNGKWEETFIAGWGASSFTVADGYALYNISLSDIASGQSILYFPWNTYCKETEYSKDIKIQYPFAYDTKNKTITIGNTQYKIEKAKDSEVNYSRIIDWSSKDDTKVKAVYRYTLEQYKYNGEVIKFTSEKEAKIAMVKLLREHFGDTFDVSKYYPNEYKEFAQLDENPIIDLAALEDDLTNGRDEWYSWIKATYPDAEIAD